MPCTARGELRAIVFRRRPVRGRRVGGRSNGSRFRRSARPASCIGQCRECARLVSCTLSRRAPYPRVALCSQTLVHHATLLTNSRSRRSLPAGQLPRPLAGRSSIFRCRGTHTGPTAGGLRPRLPGVPAFLKLRLGFLWGRHAIRACHRTVDGHRPEPAQTVGTAARFVDAADTFLVDGIEMSNFVHPSWFEPFKHPAGTKYDHLGLLKKPRLIGTRTAFARGSDSAAAPVRPSSTEASVAYRKNEISNSTGS